MIRRGWGGRESILKYFSCFLTTKQTRQKDTKTYFRIGLGFFECFRKLFLITKEYEKDESILDSEPTVTVRSVR